MVKGGIGYVSPFRGDQIKKKIAFYQIHLELANARLF